MKIQCRSFFALLLIFLLAGCASPKDADVSEGTATPGRKLTGDEIYELLADKTMILNEYGQKARIEMYANGTLLAEKGSMEKNEGIWQAREDKLCIRFRRWGYGDELCHEVIKVDDEYRQFTPSGVLASRFTVTEGVKNEPPRKTTRISGKDKVPDRAKVRRAAPDTPDVLVEEPAEESSSPDIQEPAARSRDPQTYKSDLRLIYRDMSQNCPGCNLPNLDLAGASIPHANLAGANLPQANFNKANLKWANLKGAILTGSDLRGADLSGADLAGADLGGADLTGAILNKTNLRGAIIDSAIGLDLTGAIR